MAIQSYNLREERLEDASPPIEHNRLGVLLFLLSEVTFFGALVLTYIYFRASVTDVASAAKQLDVLKTGIFSISLFSSSFTIWMADKALNKGNRGGFLLWLGLTIVLGIVFLAGQGLEYARLLSDNTTPGGDLFGSAFFTLTGFHGLHVFAGLVALLVLFGLGAAGDIKPKSAAADGVSLYWHFVDVVWVVLFSVLYLWTLLS